MPNEVSRPWYLIPIIFGLVGSLIMWIILKNDPADDVKAFIRKSWIIGAISIVAYNIPWIFILCYMPL